MRKIFFITFILLPFLYSSCKKDKVVSRVVPVPELQVKGEKFISIRVGDPMPTDEGATVSGDVPIDGNNTVLASESTVDPSTPGMYYMLYTTKTQNGYDIGTARYVAVTDYEDDVDLSGTYVRTSNGIEVPVTRKARGLYENADMGGAGLSDAIYFAVIDDSTIAAGPQYSETIHDVIETKNEALHIEDGNTYFQYALVAPGYGTATRKFIKAE